jgi:hypothetical protein
MTMSTVEPLLTIEPKRWFSWDFTVSQGTRAIADIDISWWRERGELTIEGRTFRVTRDGMIGGDFVLESSDGVVARATKPSLFRRAFVVTHGAKTWTLEPTSMFRRALTLRDGGRDAGEIAPRGAWSRRASARLPDEAPLPVQVFLIWLAVLLWKRESDAAASG